MRYLLAILLPPVAVFLTGRPFSALLNVLLWLCLWIPGSIHALLLVHEDISDERQRLLIGAISGKAIRRTVPAEWKAFTVAAMLILAAGGILGVATAITRLVPMPAGRDVAAKSPRPIPLAGALYGDVVSEHGQPTQRDAATGWAAWPAFHARFVQGRAVEVTGP